MRINVCIPERSLRCRRDENSRTLEELPDEDGSSALHLRRRAGISGTGTVAAVGLQLRFNVAIFVALVQYK